MVQETYLMSAPQTNLSIAMKIHQHSMTSRKSNVTSGWNHQPDAPFILLLDCSLVLMVGPKASWIVNLWGYDVRHSLIPGPLISVPINPPILSTSLLIITFQYYSFHSASLHLTRYPHSTSRWSHRKVNLPTRSFAKR